MPSGNQFRHQAYRSTAPTSPHRLLTAPPPLRPGSTEFTAALAEAGAIYRRAGVRAIYLVHGTFVGPDALGILQELGRFHPAARAWAARAGKQLVDKLAGERANYTPRFAELLEEGLAASGPPIPVRRFSWSSQNNHIGRADGAVRLIEALDADAHRGGRILLWGHSHAGNIFALVTNLLGGDGESRARFFEAARSYYRHPRRGHADIGVWDEVRRRLERSGPAVERPPLDLVTFGTPIRYGWETDGYARLLHVVNHRPADDLPPWQAPFPPTTERLLAAADGDYIQQLGVAGTNVMPGLLAWRTWLADRRLGHLLEGELRRRDLVARLRTGMRVAEEGTTLLVDYDSGADEQGPAARNVVQHLSGHAVYTRTEWLPFHARLVAQEYYSPGAPQSNDTPEEDPQDPRDAQP